VGVTTSPNGSAALTVSLVSTPSKHTGEGKRATTDAARTPGSSPARKKSAQFRDLDPTSSDEEAERHREADEFQRRQAVDDAKQDVLLKQAEQNMDARSNRLKKKKKKSQQQQRIRQQAHEGDTLQKFGRR
jgi:hypothetical protein